MIEFKLSAPSKVILFGEHAVVYGKAAVAASIDLRTTADFTVPLDTEQTVSISFPNVDLSVTIPMTRIRDFLSDKSLLQSIDDHDSLHKKVQQFIELDLMDLITQQNCVMNPQKKLSLEILFYLLAYISKKEKINVEPFRIHLKFCLSVNSGAGSSASFTVCLAACFLHWSHLQKNMQKVFDTNDLETISKYAFMGEKIVHGSPSGIDNFVCTYGSIIEYKKNAYMKPIPAVENMRILLVDTGVLRTTKALVERLANIRCKYPAIIDSILEAIDNISKEALKVITKIPELPKDDEASLCDAYKQLMTLVTINQSLLGACKVSHPSLDKICATAQTYELAGKLTGAGGGGYAYILLSPDTTSETIKCISKKLTDDGFSVVLTTLGCTGVKIHN